MATSREKYQLILEAREAAANKIKKLNAELNRLGGPRMVKATRQVKKLERQIKSLNQSADKGKPVISKFVKGIALGNIIANAATKAIALLKKGVDELVTATKVAARIEVLNHVMEMTGQNAGYTTAQLRGYKNAIMALGIAESESLAIEQRFIQAKLNVADATKIATAAQNLAVIAGTNSSEAALTLTDALVKQRPILLKQFGIIASLDKIYNKQAKTLGKTRGELDETEKRMAFLNEILRQSETVAGAYETAMRDVGKQVTSLPRYLQEAQKAVGTYFLPVMESMVGSAKDALQTLTKLFESTEDATAKFYASVNAFDAKAESTEALADRYDELTSKTKLTVAEQGELAGIMRRLLAIMPESADGWNSINEVISINTNAVRDNLDAKRALFRLEEGDKIKAWKKEYEDLNEEIQTGTKTLSTLEQAASLAFQYMSTGLMLSTKNYKDYDKTVTNAHATQKDLIIALNQGFDTVNDYDRAVAVLGKDLADLVLEFQTAEKSSQDLNKQLAEMSKGTMELPKLEIPQGIDIEGKFIVSKIDLPDESAIDTFTENLRIMMDSRITEPLLLAEDILPGIEDTAAVTDAINEQIKNSINADIVKDQQGRFVAAFGEIGRTGVNRLSREIASGRGQISDIWKGMAEDFITFFIQQALASVLNVFIPGLGSLLGGIFDTPVNDRMAMEQGSHFAHYFTQGALRGLNNGDSVIAGVMPNASNTPAPALAASLMPSASAAAAPAGMQVIITGNVMASDFIERDVAPMLRKLISDGKSDLALESENTTGGRDVRIH